MDSKSNNFDTDFKNVTNKWDKKEREIYEECDNAFSKEYDIQKLQDYANDFHNPQNYPKEHEFYQAFERQLEFQENLNFAPEKDIYFCTASAPTVATGINLLIFYNGNISTVKHQLKKGEYNQSKLQKYEKVGLGQIIRNLLKIIEDIGFIDSYNKQQGIQKDRLINLKEQYKEQRYPTGLIHQNLKAISRVEILERFKTSLQFLENQGQSTIGYALAYVIDICYNTGKPQNVYGDDNQFLANFNKNPKEFYDYHSKKNLNIRRNRYRVYILGQAINYRDTIRELDIGQEMAKLEEEARLKKEQEEIEEARRKQVIV